MFCLEIQYFPPTIQVKHYTGSVYVLPISADVDTEAGPEPRCYEAVTHG